MSVRGGARQPPLRGGALPPTRGRGVPIRPKPPPRPPVARLRPTGSPTDEIANLLARERALVAWFRELLQPCDKVMKKQPLAPALSSSSSSPSFSTSSLSPTLGPTSPPAAASNINKGDTISSAADHNQQQHQENTCFSLAAKYLATHPFREEDEHGMLSWLRDGVVLCLAVNRVRADIVPRIHMPTTTAPCSSSSSSSSSSSTGSSMQSASGSTSSGDLFEFRQRQNVQFFLLALEELGMPRNFLFSYQELCTGEDLPKIVQALEMFADMAANLCEEITRIHKTELEQYQRERKYSIVTTSPPPRAPPCIPKRPTKLPAQSTDKKQLLKACPSQRRRSISRALEYHQNSFQRKSRHMENLGLVAPDSSSAQHQPPARRQLPQPGQPTLSSPTLPPLPPRVRPTPGTAISPITSPVTSPVTVPTRPPVPPKLLDQEGERALVRIQARVRARQSRRIVDQALKREAHRDHVAREILSTEESYVANLQKLMDLYLTPMSSMKHLSKETSVSVKTIAGNVGIILSYNQQLLNDLRPRVNDWSPHQRVGDVFLSLTHYMKSYTEFVNSYDQCLATFQKEERHNRKYAEFLQGFINTEELGQTDAHTLEQYLILPIQRIPRYLMLLTDLVKNTDESHPDFDSLSQALEKMSEVANYVNERKREAENRFRVMGIQSSISGHFMDIAEPHRRFIEEITWKTPAGKPRVLFLFNDILLLCKPMKAGLKDIKARLQGKEQLFVFQKLVSLAQLYLVTNVDEDNANVFHLTTHEKGEVPIVLTAPSQADLKEFRGQLNQLKADLMKLRAKLKEVGADETTAPALRVDLLTSSRGRSRENRSKEPTSPGRTQSNTPNPSTLSPDSAAARAAERDRFRTQRIHRRSRSLDLGNFQQSLAGNTGWYAQPNRRDMSSSPSPHVVAGTMRERRRVRGGRDTFLSDHRSSMMSASDVLSAWLADEKLEDCRPHLQSAHCSTLEQVLKLSESDCMRIVGYSDPALSARLYSAIQIMNTPEAASGSPASPRAARAAAAPAGGPRYGSDANLQVPTRKGFRARLLNPKRWGSTPHAGESPGK